jgi:hypothetical protein
MPPVWAANVPPNTAPDLAGTASQKHTVPRGLRAGADPKPCGLSHGGSTAKRRAQPGARQPPAALRPPFAKNHGNCLTPRAITAEATLHLAKIDQSSSGAAPLAAFPRQSREKAELPNARTFGIRAPLPPRPARRMLRGGRAARGAGSWRVRQSGPLHGLAACEAIVRRSLWLYCGGGQRVREALAPRGSR